MMTIILFLGLIFATDVQAKENHGASHGSSISSESIEPDKALSWLKNGNIRYTKGFLRKDGLEKNDRARLEKGQHPHSIILSCSDSRVPPELVFDQKLGEVFSVRTAGQSLDSNAIGSIEYAIEHLGSRLIVVMGHTQCGAVKAALNTLEGGEAGSPHLNALVSDLHPHLQSFKRKPASEGISAESWSNAKGVAQDLQSRSKIISEAAKSGKIKIIPAIYHLGSGVVEWN